MKPDKIIQFEESKVDKTDVYRQLAENLQRHQIVMPNFPDYVLPELRGGADARFSPELYDLLACLNESYNQTGAAEDSVAADSWRGRLVEALKRPFRQLVVFYVNQSAAKQAAVNDDLRRALSLLAAQMENPHPRLAELERDIRELRARVKELEKERDE